MGLGQEGAAQNLIRDRAYAGRRYLTKRPSVKFIARKRIRGRKEGNESICSNKGKIMVLEEWE